MKHFWIELNWYLVPNKGRAVLLLFIIRLRFRFKSLFILYTTDRCKTGYLQPNSHNKQQNHPAHMHHPATAEHRWNRRRPHYRAASHARPYLPVRKNAYPCQPRCVGQGENTSCYTRKKGKMSIIKRDTPISEQNFWKNIGLIEKLDETKLVREYVNSSFFKPGGSQPLLRRAHTSLQSLKRFSSSSHLQTF